MQQQCCSAAVPESRVGDVDGDVNAFELTYGNMFSRPYIHATPSEADGQFSVRTLTGSWRKYFNITTGIHACMFL